MKIWCAAEAAVGLLRATDRYYYKSERSKVLFSIYLSVKIHSCASKGCSGLCVSSPLTGEQKLKAEKTLCSMLAQTIYLLHALSLLLWGDDDRGVDSEALLEHGHAGLGLAALNLGQTHPLLGLLVLHLLHQTLVVALHLLHLLPKPRRTQVCGFSEVPLLLETALSNAHLLVPLQQLVPLQEVLVLQLLLQLLVLLLEVALLQLPHGCLPSYQTTHPNR